jgi:hypothetical protein
MNANKRGRVEIRRANPEGRKKPEIRSRKNEPTRVDSLRPGKIVHKMAAIFEPRIHANEREFASIRVIRGF